MKRIKVILFVFNLLAFMPTIKAECDYNERNKLQSLANNINFTYDYKEINKGEQFNEIDFSIIITNMQKDFYIVDQTNMKPYYYNNSNEITINNYDASSTIEFIIYANSGTCKGTRLLTNYVTLPPYNRFYKDPICNSVEDYKLCNRWSRVNLPYDSFIQQVKKYKDSLKKDDVIKVEPEINFIEKLIIFLSKYSFYVFGGIIIVCSVLMFYLSHKDDFDL